MVSALDDERLLLAGDVGGTKTVLALFARGSSSEHPLRSVTYDSRKSACLEEIIRAFLADESRSPASAVLAVAGPVVDESAIVTNLPWTFSASSIREASGIPEVLLMNDLEGLAWAVPHLGESDVFVLNDAPPTDEGAIAVIASGTGLGEAFITRGAGRTVAHPTEGGHSDFAPRNPIQMELLQFLSREFDHVSYERVASGSGIPNVYRFFRDGRELTEEPSIRERLAATDDPTPVIVRAACEGESELCRQTVETFIEILGAEAGNLALKVMATGGVFLGGGIPPRVLRLLETGTFMQAFTGKGRFASLLQAIPIHVVLEPRAALRGAALRGFASQADRATA